MKSSIYIPAALAVAALVFWIVPLRPDETFYPILKDEIPLDLVGYRAGGFMGKLLLECNVCRQPATQSNSRLEAGTKLGRGDGLRLACDKHAAVPIRERYSDKINSTYVVLLVLTLIWVVIFFRRFSPKALAARKQAEHPAP